MSSDPFCADTTARSISNYDDSMCPSKITYPLIDRYWDQTVLEHVKRTSTSLVGIKEELSQLRKNEEITNLAKTEIEKELCHVSNTSKDCLDMYLRHVNSKYYLIDEVSLTQGFESAQNTKPATDSDLLPELYFCLAIGHQILFPSAIDSSTAWFVKGMTGYARLDLESVGLVGSLALVALFHVNSRPVTAYCYLGLYIECLV
jgi:hypothetical protein